MNPGDLRYRVDIQKPVESRNAFGEPEMVWTDVATGVWANIEPITGEEFFASKQINASLNAKITMRYRSDIQSNYRLMHGSEEYYIYSLLDVGLRNRELQIMCTRTIS